MLKIINKFPLSKITTLAIGGPAKAFIIVKTEDELIEAVSYAKKKELEYSVIGEGSNLLVADIGVEKLVIKNEMVGITKIGSELTIKSGTILQDLVNFANQNGLAGLEKMTGIPGTVGGAVYGNAGAYGQTISDYIVEVKSLTGIQLKNNCHFDYRYSIFKQNHSPILEIKFSLKPADSKELKKIAKETISARLEKYPPGIKCPGSFFKNILATTLSKKILSHIPDEKIPYGKVSVGYLLEEVGAKGDHLGEIEITSYHANLFINKGSGTAKDFYNLANKYFLKVRREFGIDLEPEVQLINLPPFE